MIKTTQQILYNIFSDVIHAISNIKFSLLNILLSICFYFITIWYNVRKHILLFSILDFLYFTVWIYFTYGIFSKVNVLSVFILPDIFLFIGAIYLIIYFIMFQIYGYFYEIRSMGPSVKMKEILVTLDITFEKYFINQFIVFKNMMTYIKMLFSGYMIFLLYVIYNFF